MGVSPRFPLRNRVEYVAYLLTRETLGRFGPGLLDPIGSVIGTAFHHLSRRRRRIIRSNLALAYPELEEADRRRMAAAVGRHFGRALMETLRVQRMTPEQLLRLITVEGREHIERVADSGRGAFFLSAHVGAWEVAALYLGLNLPGGIGVVHRPLDNPLLEKELEGFRQRFGNRALGKSAALRLMLAEIKRGRSVGILIDQKIRRRDVGVEVPFFGRPAKTHTVLARLVLRTGTPVIPVFAYSEPRGRFTLALGSPVPVEADDDVTSLTARYTAVTEAAIRRRPEQWLWYHDRWRLVGRWPGTAERERSDPLE